MPEAPSSIDTILPKEERMEIFDRVRTRLINLCQSHRFWLAGGSMYLAWENNKWTCKNTTDNQETEIVWEWREYILEIDPENRHLRDFLSLSGILPADVTFKIKHKDGSEQKTFREAHMIHWTPDRLLQLLSENSIRTVPIDFDRQWKYFQNHGVFWPKKEITFWSRTENEYEYLYTQFMTLIFRDGEKISYWNNGVDYSFTDWDWNTWYPNFSNTMKRDHALKHWREYVETECRNLKTWRKKTHLLSRPEWFWNFEKHYLSVGSNRFEVMHLVGKNQAEIKFRNGMYTVRLDEQGNMISKHQRFIPLSGSRTFWYDLTMGKELDHEPQ